MRTIGVAMICSVLWLSAPAVAENGSGISVTGRGAAEVTPDLARFAFEVVRQGSDAAPLKRDVDRVTAQVVALAEKLGVARADITAAVIQVRPEYRYVDGRSVLEGVHVSRTVQVTLKNLEHYAALSDGAIGAGVNSLQSVELDVQARRDLEQAALESAVEQARADARSVANRLGLVVGRALEVTVHDQGGGVAPVPMRMAMAEKSDDFRPGTLKIERQVSVRFELVPQSEADDEFCDS